MLDLDTVESVGRVIQVALTPVFLLSRIASLLSVLSTRLARVADRVGALADQLEADGPVDRRKLWRRLAYLRRRSHVLDAAVMMGTLGGVATSCAALLLFVGTLRDRPGVSLIRGLWFGAAFHNGRTRRILDRNAARRPWLTRTGELRKRGRRDARTRRGGSWRADSWQVEQAYRHQKSCSSHLVTTQNPSRATAAIECGHPASHRQSNTSRGSPGQLTRADGSRSVFKASKGPAHAFRWSPRGIV